MSLRTIRSFQVGLSVVLWVCAASALALLTTHRWPLAAGTVVLVACAVGAVVAFPRPPGGLRSRFPSP